MLKQFSPEELPPAFRYPQAFLDLVAAPAPELPGEWWLIGKNPDFARFCLATIQGKGGKLLIPFAKDDDSGDIACFDGEDTSGSPRVYFDTGEEDYAGIDWSSRFSQSFEDWLASI